MARLLLGELRLAGAQVHLGERGNGLRGVRLASDLERDRERGLEEALGLLGIAEQEGQAAEVVQEPADAEPVVLLLVELLRPLGVRAREHPLSVPLRDDRRLEVAVRECVAVAEPLGELERRLDVLTRPLQVVLAPVAPRPPAEDPRAEAIVDPVGVLHEVERFRKERDGGRDRRHLVAAAAHVEEDVRAVDAGEGVTLAEIACTLEERERFLDAAEL